MNKNAKNYPASPRKYFAFDVSIADCKDCGFGKLYQECKVCRNAQSCDGFAIPQGEHFRDCCCTCFINHQKTKEKANEQEASSSITRDES